MSKQTVFQVMKSVIAAAVGIQSNKNREQDFQQGSVMAFMIGGVLFTITFIVMIMLVVSLVL